ncbi:MAG: hypothetical protein DRQ52_10890 [Gammaproteobacteria bacterium]|nr:MAG: hypothetical protein DRQ52_10890 [Gammaproteobacteria bacterium]
MRHHKSILHYLTFALAFVLTVPIIANAGQYEDFRFPREASTTKDGYPTPLSGKTNKKRTEVVKKKGISLKK